LRQGGYACIRNSTRETNFPHRHFFPALRALIDSDLPSRREIESVFAAGGFTPVLHQVVTQVTAIDWPSFIEKSALRADSFLARLSDDDFQQGDDHTPDPWRRDQSGRCSYRRNRLVRVYPTRMRKPPALPVSSHALRPFRDGDAAKVNELALVAFDQVASR
jgi:hypothetical protein